MIICIFSLREARVLLCMFYFGEVQFEIDNEIIVIAAYEPTLDKWNKNFDRRIDT